MLSTGTAVVVSSSREENSCSDCYWASGSSAAVADAPGGSRHDSGRQAGCWDVVVSWFVLNGRLQSTISLVRLVQIHTMAPK